jgi:predicted phage terminase large subunit-like protein
MTVKLTPDEFDPITRLDFWAFTQRVFTELTGEPFADNFHIQKLCAEVDRVRTDANVRLAIALPPRSLKSIIVSVALPAWLLGHDPGREIVCVSYGQELADKLSADCRRVMLTPWYRRLFPGTVLDRLAISHLATTAGGKRYATSVGGTLTGMGADVIIVDNPMKPDEALSDAERKRANDWAKHTLFTRINNKKDDRIIIVMQRLHEDDTIGHVMDFADFELMAFPAIAQEDEVHEIRTPFGTLRYQRRAGEALHPEREPLEVLEKQRRLLGADFFAAQYQQSPTPPGGGLVKIAWFGRFDLSRPPPFERVVQSWDCASKASQLADYSVCTTWGVRAGGDLYLTHVLRVRLEYPELKRKVRLMAEQHRAGTVVIEDTSAGTQLIQELAREGFARIEPVKATKDKVMRMAAQTPRIEAGRVFLPHEAAWLPDYLHEVAMFPKGRHDDQVDSTAQALAYVSQPTCAEGILNFMRQELLKPYGLRPDHLTILYDYEHKSTVFTAPSGREVRRDPDGFYHVAPQEWEAIKWHAGVTLVEDLNAESSAIERA